MVTAWLTRRISYNSETVSTDFIPAARLLAEWTLSTHGPSASDVTMSANEQWHCGSLAAADQYQLQTTTIALLHS